MARRSDSKPQTTAYPPIPSALMKLLDADDHYDGGSGFTQNADGTIKHNPDWKTYRRLRREYETAAGIKPVDFRTVVQSQG